MTNQSISQLAPDAGAAGIFLVVRFAAGIPSKGKRDRAGEAGQSDIAKSGELFS